MSHSSSNIAKNWKAPFLEYLSTNGCVKHACAYAGVTARRVYQARRKDPEFERAWKEAIAIAVEKLEISAWKRATAERNPSDALLMFLLRSYKPKRYGERFRNEHSGELIIKVVYEDAEKSTNDQAPEAARRPERSDRDEDSV